MNPVILLFLLFFSQPSPVEAQEILPEINVDSMPLPEVFPREILSGNLYFGSSHYLATEDLRILTSENNPHTDWITWIMIISLTSLALARFLFPARVGQSFKATLGMRFFNQMERDGNFFNETFAYLLLLNFLAAMALLITITILTFTNQTLFHQWHPGLVFLLIFLIIAVFYSLKGVVTGSIAWIFKTQTANSIYLKNIYLFNQVTGIALLPLVIYSAYNVSSTGIIIAWALVITGGVLKVTRNIVIGIQYAGFSAYYIILYLCAIELAPLLVIIKAASRFVST